MTTNKDETNRQYKWKRLRNILNCPLCPIRGGENKQRTPKHGKTKPKYKTKAKGR